MSAVSSARGKRPDPLAKKIPENPKFKHVRSTIDTGASITRHIEKIEEFKRDYKVRKDEIFKRMKVTTFVQLIVQVADFDAHEDDFDGKGDSQTSYMGDSQTSYRPDTADREVQQIQSIGGESGAAANGTDNASSHPDTSRSRLEQVIRGVGEADSDAGVGSKPLVNTISCPYLLLDIREKDSYDEGHIITAKSYPNAMLARSVNYETKDMLRYKNKEGRIIIMYDNDESQAPRAVTTLVERGYENLFMLSGGLKVANKIFPEGLINGSVPAGLVEPQLGPKGKAQPPPPRVPAQADKNDFTEEDLDRLIIYMDSALSDNSSSSRLSQRPKGGRVGTSLSTISSTTAMTGTGRPPFK